MTAAVVEGRLHTIEALALKGVDPVIENGDGHSPLRLASYHDNGALETLLKLFPSLDLDARDSADGATPLQV